MQFTMVSTGRKYTCGILANGTSTCWGQKISSQWIAAPSHNISWAQISSGYMHNCGVTTDGESFCWGQDTGGQSTVPDSFQAAV
jgi:alpha-tubulin suppressor-like RCC1 family protein